MHDRAVVDLRELARLDEELASRASALRELDAQAAEVRTRAETIDAFFAAYPDEDTRRREEIDAAREDLARRERERAEAAEALARASDDDARMHAQRAVERADDHVEVARRRLAAAESDHDRLEREAASLPDEVPALERRAQSVAAAVRDVPQPEAGPRALVEWASRAHAELFVGARQIDAQRDRVIREANELASSVLGEPTYGSTAAQALARVERVQSA